MMSSARVAISTEGNKSNTGSRGRKEVREVREGRRPESAGVGDLRVREGGVGG